MKKSKEIFVCALENNTTLETLVDNISTSTACRFKKSVIVT